MNKMFTFMRESNVARFFIPAGLILIIFGIFVFVANTKNQDYIKVESTISNVVLQEKEYYDNDGNFVDATYQLTIKYTVDGKEYTTTLDNMAKYSVGDKMTIYYNPKNPAEITQVKSLVLPIVIIIAGLASLTGGVISAVNAVKRYKKMKEQERSWENAK